MPGIKTVTVTPEGMESTRRQMKLIWGTVHAASRSGHWPPAPSELCDWCYFQPACPAQGNAVAPDADAKTTLEAIRASRQVAGAA